MSIFCFFGFLDDRNIFPKDELYCSASWIVHTRLSKNIQVSGVKQLGTKLLFLVPRKCISIYYHYVKLLVNERKTEIILNFSYWTFKTLPNY